MEKDKAIDLNPNQEIQELAALPNEALQIRLIESLRSLQNEWSELGEVGQNSFPTHTLKSSIERLHKIVVVLDSRDEATDELPFGEPPAPVPPPVLQPVLVDLGAGVAPLKVHLRVAAYGS